MSQEQLIRLSVFLIMLVTFSISGYYRRKADLKDEKTSFDEENPTLLKVRNIGALLMYGSILVFLVYPRLIAWSQVNLPTNVRWAAVIVQLLMVPAFYWQLSNLANNITPTVTIRSEHELITSGPYKYIRHPLYTFGFLMILSVAVASASLLIFSLVFITWIPLAMRTPLEEEKLIEAFGEDYKEYITHTGRYLPKLFKR
jgi:protein-S-isoprenylcysteine O-methyltransferase Ste14